MWSPFSWREPVEYSNPGALGTRRTRLSEADRCGRRFCGQALICIRALEEDKRNKLVPLLRQLFAWYFVCDGAKCSGGIVRRLQGLHASQETSLESERHRSTEHEAQLRNGRRSSCSLVSRNCCRSAEQQCERIVARYRGKRRRRGQLADQ